MTAEGLDVGVIQLYRDVLTRLTFGCAGRVRVSNCKLKKRYGIRSEDIAQVLETLASHDLLVSNPRRTEVKFRLPKHQRCDIDPAIWSAWRRKRLKENNA